MRNSAASSWHRSTSALERCTNSTWRWQSSRCSLAWRQPSWQWHESVPLRTEKTPQKTKAFDSYASNRLWHCHASACGWKNFNPSTCFCLSHGNAKETTMTLYESCQRLWWSSWRQRQVVKHWKQHADPLGASHHPTAIWRHTLPNKSGQERKYCCMDR